MCDAMALELDESQWVFAFEDEMKARCCRFKDTSLHSIQSHVIGGEGFQEFIRGIHPHAISITPWARSAGEYFPRIWRPGNCPTQEIAQGIKVVRQSTFAAEILVDELMAMFRMVTPAQSTDGAFGHEIRNLLTLACMEVEASWANVLRANGYTSSSDRWSTNDYVKLCSPMRLDTFEVSLTSFPEYDTFRPFAGWDPNHPTKSLGWYDAYNKVKHDREQNMSHATLRNAIHATSAYVCMLYAQFGPPHFSPDLPQWDQHIREVKVDGWAKFPPAEYNVHFEESYPMNKPWTATPYPL